MNDDATLDYHHEPSGFSDRFAFALVRFTCSFTDVFLAGRFGHRAVVLESVAAVPGMVGGALQHLRSLRRLMDDEIRIRTPHRACAGSARAVTPAIRPAVIPSQRASCDTTGQSVFFKQQ